MKVKLFKTPIFFILSLIFLLCKFSLADTISLGISQVYTTIPYKGSKNKLLTLPGTIDYDGKYFYIKETNAGYYLLKNKYNQFSILASYKYLDFKIDDSNFKGFKLKVLNKKHNFMSGLSYNYNTNLGMIKTLYLRNIFDKHNNATAEFSYLYPMINRTFTIIPGVGIFWSSKYHNDQYYGITNTNSSNDTTIGYNAENSWSPYIEFYFNYNISKNLRAYIIARYCHLSDIITRSPAVNKDNIITTVFSIAYRF